MKKLFISTMAMSLFLSSNVLASVVFKSIPLKDAWGIVCNLVDNRGHGTTDYQVTTYYMNSTRYLGIKYLDSLKGDNSGSVALTSIESAQGGGNDLVTYKGDIVKNASGAMLKGKKQLSVIVDYRSRINGKPNTFKAKLLVDNVQPVDMPAWAKERELQCELVPR